MKKDWDSGYTPPCGFVEFLVFKKQKTISVLPSSYRKHEWKFVSKNAELSYH